MIANGCVGCAGWNGDGTVRGTFQERRRLPNVFTVPRRCGRPGGHVGVFATMMWTEPVDVVDQLGTHLLLMNGSCWAPRFDNRTAAKDLPGLTVR